MSALADALRTDIARLAGEIGERHTRRPRALAAAAAFIEEALAAAGHRVERQEYEVGGVPCANLEVEVAGGPEVIVVGAHYDTVPGSPGANDNATGVAATLALARAFAGRRPARTLRFVAFVNEEMPYFHTDRMGSFRYARRCRERGERVVGMLSLETIGYYSDEPRSQAYPFPLGLLYPSTGNFVGFVANLRSRAFGRRVASAFRRHARFPCESVATFGGIPGVGWSDHWAFWEAGFPAVMVTDTALFRYPHYHTADDTPDKVDHESLARVVAGLERTVEDLAHGP